MADPRGLLDDLGLAVAFLTRLPVPWPLPRDGAAASRALRMFPLVGAAIGLVAGLAWMAALALGCPPLLAACLAMTVQLLLTGALHEDGLADCADGLGGGRDREAKLAIMRDSRLGSFGALALMLSLLARVAALASLGAAEGLLALVAAHALGRAALPLALATMPPARTDGLSAALPPPATAVWFPAALVAVAIAVLALGSDATVLAVLAGTAAAALLRGLALRQVGGHTGDVLGAVEQVVEIAALAVAAAWW